MCENQSPMYVDQDMIEIDGGSVGGSVQGFGNAEIITPAPYLPRH